MVGEAVKVVERHFGFSAPTLQPHGFKRGTVSMLKRLGMTVEDINLFVGWSLHSTSFATYYRRVLVQDIDRDFFHDVLDFSA